MKSKMIWFLIEILMIYCVDSRKRNEALICPNHRIDAITNLWNQSLIATKGSNVWISQNANIDKITEIRHELPQIHPFFQNDINDLIFDEQEVIFLVFKDKYFSVSTYLGIDFSIQEIDTYFDGIVKVDASMLVTHPKQWCWQQFRCQTLHLFTGHFLWSFNWFHFWHIESRTEKPIDMKSINVYFPDNLDAAFAQNNYIFLIKEDFFFQIPIERFPSEISIDDLKRLSIFDQIIRCQFNPHLNRRQSSNDLLAISSVIKETFSTGSTNISTNITTITITEPTAQSKTETVTKPMTEPTTQPTTQPTVEPKTDSTTESITKSTIQPLITTMAKTAIVPKTETVTKLTTGPTNRSTTESKTESATHPTTESTDKRTKPITGLTNSLMTESKIGKKSVSNRSYHSLGLSTETVKANSDESLTITQTMSPFIPNTGSLKLKNSEKTKKDSVNKSEEKHRMLSVTWVWVTAVVLTFIAIIAITGLLLWKKNRGYYSLDNE